MQYSKTLKQQVFEKFFLGFSTDEIHALFPIPKTTIDNWKGRWKKNMQQHTVSDLPMPMIGTLVFECEKVHKQLLEMQKELGLINSSKALQLVPKTNRLEIDLTFDKQAPKELICCALKIPLSSFCRGKSSHKSFSETVKKRLKKELLFKRENSKDICSKRLPIRLREDPNCSTCQRYLHQQKAHYTAYERNGPYL